MTMALETCFIEDHLPPHDCPSGVLQIDLKALQANYRLIADRMANASAGAVLKADAYGLGASTVFWHLYQTGCRHFFFAQLNEILSLNLALPKDANFYVLNGLFAGTEAACLEAGAVPVLNSLEQVTAWAAFAQSRSARFDALLQIDTGMARLGLSVADCRRLLETPKMLDGVEIRYLMSHLACADDPEHPANVAQLRLLAEISGLFPSTPVSILNSGGVFLSEDCGFALSRTGIALYGGKPHAGKSNPMRPVIRLDVRVIQVREVPANTGIGYGASFVTERPMRLATIAAGYADGLPRSLSNRGAAYFNGKRLPIVGRISMDTTIIDISGTGTKEIQSRSMVELIGPHQSLDDIAIDAGTISYEILTRLGKRYQRVYR